MQRVRSALKALVPLALIFALVFTACEDDSGPEVPTDSTNPVNQSVSDLDLTISSTSVNGYYGQSDTLTVTATARDANNDPVAEASVELSIEEGPGRLEMTTTNETDESGQVQAQFITTLLESDTTKIKATVGSSITEQKSVVFSVEDIRISMTANPSNAVVEAGVEATSNLSVRVLNNLGVAIRGVPVGLQLLEGDANLSEPEFDNETATYRSTITVDEVLNTAEVQVRAFVQLPAGIATTASGGASGHDAVLKGSELIENDALNRDGDTGAGDGNRADSGFMSGSKSFDAPSVPTTMGAPRKAPGHTLAQSVTSDTVTVRWRTLNSSVSSIFLDVDPGELEVVPGESGSAEITAIAYDENNNGIDELQIFLRLYDPEDGRAGTLSPPEPTDSTGVTSSTITTNGESGEWIIEARTTSDTSTEPMASTSLTVLEEYPDWSVAITLNPEILEPAPEASDTARVRLVLHDENNAGVSNRIIPLALRPLIPGTPVGSISPQDTTDFTGVADRARITTNGRFGTWIVEARPFDDDNAPVFRDTLKVLTGSATRISVAADTNRIAVRGTNGIESTEIRARILNQSGNPIAVDQQVYFLAERIPDSPTDEFRVEINGNDGSMSPPPYEGIPYDSVMSENGEAQVTLTSGMNKGGVRLRIWTADPVNEDVPLVAVFDGVQVVSGPPAFIEAGFGYEGEMGGSSIWNIEVSARVTDLRQNDVAGGYQVWFEVEEDIAHILDNGVTGNASPISDLTNPGVAYSALTYHSEYTNETVNMNVYTYDYNGDIISDELEITLPIQQPTGVLYISPANWDYDEMPGNSAIFDLRLEVYDGHNYPISGQLVHFSPQKGRISKTTVGFTSDLVPFAITGTEEYDESDPNATDDDEPGIANRYLLLTVTEAFPDPMTPETTVTVNAQIVGVPDASVEPVTINLIQ